MMGIPVGALRVASTEEELRELISQFQNGQRHVEEVTSRVPVKKKQTAPAKRTKQEAPVASPAARTAPATRKPKKRQAPVAAKAKPKSAPSPAKRQSRSMATASDNGITYRNMLTDIDWERTTGPGGGWKPRQGSAVEIMFDALKFYKGDREKTLQYIMEEYPGRELIEFGFVGPRKANGELRSKEEKENYLRYRIARTAWDFALKTGQHKKNPNFGGKARAQRVAAAAKPESRAPARKPVGRKPAKATRPPKRTAKK
jgi:hypothetical protein